MPHIHTPLRLTPPEPLRSTPRAATAARACLLPRASHLRAHGQCRSRHRAAQLLLLSVRQHASTRPRTRACLRHQSLLLSRANPAATRLGTVRVRRCSPRASNPSAPSRPCSAPAPPPTCRDLVPRRQRRSALHTGSHPRRTPAPLSLRLRAARCSCAARTSARPPALARRLPQPPAAPSLLRLGRRALLPRPHPGLPAPRAWPSAGRSPPPAAARAPGPPPRLRWPPHRQPCAPVPA
jgi:hypothetical protein